MSELYKFAAEVGVPSVLALGGGVLVYLLHQWNTTERKETRTEHAAERKEWREASEKVQNRTVDAINELSQAIKDGNNRRRSSDT